MSFLKKLFGSKTLCPHCGNHDARESLAGIVCPNPQCPNHRANRATARAASRPAAAPSPQRASREPWTEGPRVRIQYKNWKKELKDFQADPGSARPHGRRFSVRVEPTGRRICLAHDRVRNAAELAGWLEAVKAGPRGDALRVLRYHGKRGTTSPACDALRQQYPKWKTGKPEA